MRLTKQSIAGIAVPNGRAETIVFDDALPGFGIWVRAGGSQTWVFQYKTGAQHRRVTLGRVSAIEPATARKMASELYAKVRLGADPAGERAETQGHAAETFGACVRTYLTWQQQRLRSGSYRHIERHLNSNFAALHGIRIDQLNRREVAAQLARMADRPTETNRTRASLSAFLNWCVGQGLLETAAALPTNTYGETARERVLSTAELRAVWHALPGCGDDYSDIVRLLALTGARANEIGGLRWEEIDFDRGVIVLPAQRVKNGRRHEIPMAPAVAAILKARPQNGRPTVFGTGRGGFTGWSHAKARLDQAAGIAPWRIHDLRRSCATMMAEIGVQPHIVEAVLNHISGHKGGIAGVYNRAVYSEEKATALTRWAAHVLAIVEGRSSNVRPLRA